MRGLLAELLPPECLPLPPTIVKGDNSGSIALCKNPVHSKRNKHFPVQLHYTRQLRDQGVLDIAQVPTAVMWADAMTKVLPRIVHLVHRAVLLGSNNDMPSAHFTVMRLCGDDPPPAAAAAAPRDSAAFARVDSSLVHTCEYSSLEHTCGG
jgi:hypothetical protein